MNEIETLIMSYPFHYNPEKVKRILFAQFGIVVDEEQIRDVRNKEGLKLLIRELQAIII